jgi:hypothetical protein
MDEYELRKELLKKAKFSIKKIPAHALYILKHGETPSHWLKKEYKKLDNILQGMDIHSFIKSDPILGSRRMTKKDISD